ncbi:MAG: hypothetical protein NVSMB68_06250 [Thermoanaerobaculia bacterium]
MTTIKRVENRIFKIEGFRVAIVWPDGTDVRSDKKGMPNYPFERAAADDITVEDWRQTRFRPHYPGFDVEVLNRRRDVVAGNTKLKTVRDSFR